MNELFGKSTIIGETHLNESIGGMFEARRPNRRPNGSGEFYSRFDPADADSIKSALVYVYATQNEIDKIMKYFGK